MTTNIMLPRTVRMGGGSLKQLGSLLKELGFHRPLLVTDEFMYSNGVAQRCIEEAEAAGLDIAVFSRSVPDPTTESLKQGLYTAHRHDADSVIGLGGGSPIDTAKAIALLAVQGGHMRDHKAPKTNQGPALPIIAIPTTAGTGSEATQFTIITDSESDEKMLCIGPAFLPIAAILDFELTLSMPARLTADTGIDALTHALEAYVSKRANSFADNLALRAIQSIGKNLETVYGDGGNRTAREAMMLASMQAGMAFSNSSVAMVHGMARPLGAHFHVAHGLSIAMLLPAVTRFSTSSAQHRYADCARALTWASDLDSDALAVDRLVDGLEQISRNLDVPTPATLKFDKTHWDALVPLMSQQAIDSGSPSNNPRVPEKAEVEDLFYAMYA